MTQYLTKKNLVSGNAGDEKYLQTSGREFFLIDFPEVFSLFFFSFYCFFCSLVFFALLFFENKSIYSDTISTMRVGEW